MSNLAKAYGIPDDYAFHGETFHYPAAVVLNGQGQVINNRLKEFRYA